MTINILLVLTAFALVTNSCNSDTDNYKLDYPKYYDKYTFKQLTDLLYADTLSIGLDVDSGRTQRQWYAERINELINDLRDDWKKPDSLFPMKSFDKIKITQSPWEWDQTLSSEQANKLLEIINNPTSFNWSETTSDVELVFEFYNKGIQVCNFSVGADKSVINCSQFRKMKFGHLNQHAQQELKQLLVDIDLKY